jgi:type IV fimbrial biogenesis protein FimT
MLSRARQSGMSLVEILIAIAIVALLLGFAAPSATTWIQNMQLRSAADSIFNAVQLARTEAIRRNTSVALELTDQNSTAWHVCLFDATNNACTSTDVTSRPGAEAGGNARVGTATTVGDTTYALAIASGAPGLVAFDPLGRPLAAAGSLARIDVRNPTLTSGERRLVIVVTPGGSTRMCDPALNGLSPPNPMGCV